MPLYDYKCDGCDVITEQFGKPVEPRHLCAKCGAPMRRLISTNYSVHGDLEPYLDYEMSSKPVPIKSKKHRERMMKKHGVAELIGKGWE